MSFLHEMIRGVTYIPKYIEYNLSRLKRILNILINRHIITDNVFDGCDRKPFKISKYF